MWKGELEVLCKEMKMKIENVGETLEQMILLYLKYKINQSKVYFIIYSRICWEYLSQLSKMDTLKI